MLAPLLLFALVLSAGAPGGRSSPAPRVAALAPRAPGARRGDATGVERPLPENLLAGPALCVLRYLDAVRIAGPRAAELRRRAPPPDPRAYSEARKLTAPRTLAQIDRWAARGRDHPLAPWRDAAHDRVLESFQLLAARRAPLGAAVITVKERFQSGQPDDPLRPTVSEYLVARVDGRWKIVARRPGGTFDDEAIADRYAGFFDAAGPAR